eukprot:s1600_g23.t1
MIFHLFLKPFSLLVDDVKVVNRRDMGENINVVAEVQPAVHTLRPHDGGREQDGLKTPEVNNPGHLMPLQHFHQLGTGLDKLPCIICMLQALHDLILGQLTERHLDCAGAAKLFLIQVFDKSCEI